MAKLFKQFITEAIRPWNIMPVWGGMRDVPVYRVRNAASLMAVMRTTHHRDIRGVFHDSHIDVWVAFEALHSDYYKEFGHEGTSLHLMLDYNSKLHITILRTNDMNKFLHSEFFRHIAKLDPIIDTMLDYE